jgi:branched-chain amino acid transport system substrate-binding protein
MKRLVVPNLALAMALAACGPKPPTPVITAPDGTVVQAPPEPKEEEERAAAAAAQEAAQLRQKGDGAAALAKEDQIIALYPGTLAAANLYMARAEAALQAGVRDEAIAWFEKLLFYRPSYPAIDALRERYAGLLLAVGRHGDAANMLRSLYKAQKDPPTQRRLGLLLVNAFSQGGQARAALEILVELTRNNAVLADERATLVQRALDIIDGALTFKEAASLWNDVDDDKEWAALQPALAFKLAKIYYHVRDFDHSEDMLELIESRFTASDVALAAREFMQRLRARFQVDPRAIGVVLPLSGKYQQYGERSLAAVKQAFASDPTLRLVVKDTQGDSAATAQAVEDLVIKDHVIAVIGPLFSNEAQAAALKAEELSVPLIALNHKEGLPELGPYVFRTALTIEAQAKELARAAFEQLKFSRFALLYPRNTYGMEFARAFWDEVDRRKGEIRAVETYEHDQTTFMEPIRKMVGRYYMLARHEYKTALDELRLKRLPPHKLQQELERVEKRIPPLVDFDAIVIPDGPKNIGLIAPALAFEDIVVTRDPKELEKIKKATANEGVTPVTLLGASTWNSPNTLQVCEQYCEGAVFVDAYFPDDPDPKVRDFVTTYKEAMGIDPQLSEAQAYDTAGLLRWMVTTGRPADRNAMRNQLEGAATYEGVTGKLRFTKEGDAEKDLFMLTIEAGTIKRYTPPGPQPRG